MEVPWTGLEQRYVDARTDIVEAVSLFLVGQDQDGTQTFLKFWNGALERDIILEPPTAKSHFILALIKSTMARVRTIAAAAPAQQNRTVH